MDLYQWQNHDHISTFHEKLRNVWTPKTTSYIYLIGGTNNNMKFDHRQCTIKGTMLSVRQFTSQILQNSRMRHFSLKGWCNQEDFFYIFGRHMPFYGFPF